MSERFRAVALLIGLIGSVAAALASERAVRT